MNAHIYCHKIVFFIFSDKSPLLQKGGSEHMFETMEMEIEQLLSKVIYAIKGWRGAVDCTSDS